MLTIPNQGMYYKNGSFIPARDGAAAGLPVRFIETFGGSDNAALQANGIDSLVAANAMFNCHSTDEYTTVDDLQKTAMLIYHLITDTI